MQFPPRHPLLVLPAADVAASATVGISPAPSPLATFVVAIVVVVVVIVIEDDPPKAPPY